MREADDQLEVLAMPMIDLAPAAREVERLLDGVKADHLTGPTPCGGYSVADLLDHLMGLSLAFTWAARKTPPAGGTSAPNPAAENLDPQWRTVLPQRLADLVAAWRDPGAWAGMTEAGGITMPAEQMGAVALDELVLHGWDLARATGQPFTCDPDSTATVLAFTERPRNPAPPETGFSGRLSLSRRMPRPSTAHSGSLAATLPGRPAPDEFW
jgi:uncharacterized protein (TIGR03086 family)